MVHQHGLFCHSFINGPFDPNFKLNEQVGNHPATSAQRGPFSDMKVLFEVPFAPLFELVMRRCSEALQ